MNTHNMIPRGAAPNSIAPRDASPAGVAGEPARPSAGDEIVFSNGTLSVPAFLAGRPQSEGLAMDRCTPALPFAFDPAATCPTWEQFVEQSVGHEPEQVRLLQEWFGYCMTPDTSLRKMMFLSGESDASPLILDALRWLLGDDLAVSLWFREVFTPTGVRAMLGKHVCVIPDVGSKEHTWVLMGRTANGEAVLENRPFLRPLIEARPPLRFTFASGSLSFPGPSYVLPRVIALDVRHRFTANDAEGIDRTIRAELPGIAVWALEGLRSLCERGRFAIPDWSWQASDRWWLEANPLAAFLNECTEKDAGGEVLRDHLFDCYAQWGTGRGLRMLIKSKFFERLRANAPHVHRVDYQRGGRDIRAYRGIRMKGQFAAS